MGIDRTKLRDQMFYSIEVNSCLKLIIQCIIKYYMEIKVPQNLIILNATNHFTDEWSHFNCQYTWSCHLVEIMFHYGKYYCVVRYLKILKKCLLLNSRTINNVRMFVMTSHLEELRQVTGAGGLTMNKRVLLQFGNQRRILNYI